MENSKIKKEALRIRRKLYMETSRAVDKGKLKPTICVKCSKKKGVHFVISSYLRMDITWRCEDCMKLWKKKVNMSALDGKGRFKKEDEELVKKYSSWKA
jgi:hypothetical protein